MSAPVVAEVDLGPALVDWIENRAGGSVVQAERVPGGGRHEAWLIDVDGPVGELFLRYDRGDPAESGDPFTLHREAQFYVALQGTDVPVPRILGIHPVEQAVLSTRVPGETWFSRLRDEHVRLAVARDFMCRLAALHAVDPHRLQVPGQDPDASLPELVEREITTWEGLYRCGDYEPEPLVEFGLTWLRRHLPDVHEAPVIVQGDTGPGNFLYQDGAVSAVLDWELAHLGDIHDDLGWLALRAVQEPFTELADRIADYATVAGRPIDWHRVRYYRAFAEFRVVVLGNRRRQGEDLLGEVGNGLIYTALHRRLFVEAVADVTGSTLEEPPPLEAEPSERSWLYDAALAQVREIIVPRSTDPFVVLRSKGLARLLKYLQQADRFADAKDRDELTDLTAVLGRTPGSVAEGRRLLAQLIAAGRAPQDDELLQLFGRRVARERQVLRPAMGVLADRHFDPLPS